MSFLNKLLILIIVLGVGVVIYPNNDNNFVLANHGNIIAPNCQDSDGLLEVLVAWNKHEAKGFTGYATTIIAGRCPPLRFTSRVNGTTDLRNKVEQDIRQYIHTNNVTFDMMKFGKDQNIDGRGNFTI